MKLLLDTHAFLWLMAEPEKLSGRALEACADETNILLLSVASVWEIQIKQQLKKLTLEIPLGSLVDQQHTANNLEVLPVELRHVLALSGLPMHHNDPFDRLLVAQALTEGATLITADAQIAKYAVEVLW